MDTEDSEPKSSLFRHAQEIAHLSNEPAPDAGEERNSDKIVVEHRRNGNTELTAVLCAHTLENAPVIAAALRSSDVLALEEVGHESEVKRRKHEELYTKLISSQADPVAVEQAFAEIAKQGFGVAGILSHLRGTDKRVVLLDINRDNPNFPIVSKAIEARSIYINAVAKLAPVNSTKSTLEDAIRTTGEEYSTRDAILAEQIKTLTDEVGQQEPDASIGIMMGAMHYRTIESIGQEYDHVTPEQIAKRAEKTMSLFGYAVEAAREGDEDKLGNLINRVQLSDYLMTQGLGPGAKSQQSDKLVKQLDDAQLERILGQLDKYLSATNQPYSEKIQKVGSYLKAVIDLL